MKELVNNIMDTFDNICRICLRDDKLEPFEELSIYTTFMELLYSHSTESYNEKHLPRNICRYCVSELENLSVFITKAKNTTMELEEILQNENTNMKNESAQKDEDEFSYYDSHTEEQIILEFESDENSYAESSIGNRIPENKPYPCDICQKCFTCETTWKYHMNTHPEVTLWECAICEWAGLEENSLDLHVTNSHGCDRESNFDFTQIDNEFICNICGEKLFEKNGMVKHLEVHADEKYRSCHICGLKFILEETLVKHLNVHLEKKEFKCNICGKLFTKKVFLDTHIAIYHGPGEKLKKERVLPFLCSYCGKKFASERYLQRHSKTCNDEDSREKFLCGTCGKKFTHKTNLTRHIEVVHDALKKFSCKLCGEKFTVKNSLKYHMNIHSDSKPYQCTVCSRGFRQPSALIRHNRTVHTDEKKAQCTICYKWLKSDETLKSHKKRHMEIHHQTAGKDC